jgi:hypothetical protein
MRMTRFSYPPLRIDVLPVLASVTKSSNCVPDFLLDEESEVVVGRLNSTPHPAPQDDQLMSEHRILRLKPAFRLQWRGQHRQNKPNQRDHRANLADSVT